VWVLIFSIGMFSYDIFIIAKNTAGKLVSRWRSS